MTDISKDGKTIVFFEGWEGGGEHYGVYLRSMNGSPAVRLGDGAWGKLSPDGKFVLSLLIRVAYAIVLLPTGPGNRRSFRAEIAIAGSAVSPDGKWATAINPEERITLFPTEARLSPSHH